MIFLFVYLLITINRICQLELPREEFLYIFLRGFFQDFLHGFPQTFVQKILKKFLLKFIQGIYQQFLKYSPADCIIMFSWDLLKPIRIFFRDPSGFSSKTLSEIFFKNHFSIYLFLDVSRGASQDFFFLEITAEQAAVYF